MEKNTHNLYTNSSIPQSLYDEVTMVSSLGCNSTVSYATQCDSSSVQYADQRCEFCCTTDSCNDPKEDCEQDGEGGGATTAGPCTLGVMLLGALGTLMARL